MANSWPWLLALAAGGSAYAFLMPGPRELSPAGGLRGFHEGAAPRSSAWGATGATSAAVCMAAIGASAAVRRRASAGSDGFSYKKAFFFPGQGAQSVGMCKDLVEVPKAKEMFETASDIVGYDLLDCCINGPKEELDRTAVSQPAIFVASMAAVEKLRAEGGAADIEDATVAMGLSLGEYSALSFAGALSFEDGVKVTKARGEAMQAAADAAASGMVSVVGLDSAKTEELCAKVRELTGQRIQIANYLCKGNYTVSGDKDACAKLAEIAKPEFKARLAVPLAVAGAFHTDFMAPAVEKLEEVLASVDLQTPRIPVVSNVDAKPHGDPETIKATLAKQVTSPVQWETQMKDLSSSGTFEQGFECGPGKVIAGIMKRIDKAAAANITNITA